MIQLSKKMLTFVPSVETDWRHRGERLSFDPLENLENSTYTGEKSESCFSCSCIYTAYSAMESAHINICRCELISFLRIRVFQNLLAKECKKAHTLCANWNFKYLLIINNSNYEQELFYFNSNSAVYSVESESECDGQGKEGKVSWSQLQR